MIKPKEISKLANSERVRCNPDRLLTLTRNRVLTYTGICYPGLKDRGLFVKKKVVMSF